jgi:hypothetical protein
MNTYRIDGKDPTKEVKPTKSNIKKYMKDPLKKKVK